MKPNNPPTILIAGGAGYIGSHANKILNKRGFVESGDMTEFRQKLGSCPRIPSRGHREFAKWGHFVLGDLADKDQLRLCFKTYQIEAVMHYCAFCYVGESVNQPAEYLPEQCGQHTDITSLPSLF